MRWKYFIILICLLVVGCSKEEKHQQDHFIKITREAQSNYIYFNGYIKPKNKVVIASFVEGSIANMPIKYGAFVKKGQLVFSIRSLKFFADYKTALMEYVKAKNECNTNKTLLDEAKFLHDNELISDDDYKSKKSNYYASQLALLQAKDTLSNLLKQLHIKKSKLYELSIADIDKITKALHLQKRSDTLNIYSSKSGILLPPASKGDDGKTLEVGSQVKLGDELAVVGDMSGLSVDFFVNELVVNKLKVKQKVDVTGVAFPGETLKGFISQVDRESNSDSDSVPKFHVRIAIPELTKKQRNIIHVGMSAKVSINLKDKPTIVIPFEALHEDGDNVFVRLINKSTIKVEVGRTTEQGAVILSGLNEGDEIASHY